MIYPVLIVFTPFLAQTYVTFRHMAKSKAIKNRPAMGRFHYWLPATQVTTYRLRFIALHLQPNM